ncbi:hypothetical protein ACFL2S_04075 [Thermodesulfobacteriota bacterium]
MANQRELKAEEAYYEDNYGTWQDIQDPRVVDLYEEVKSKSEFKDCIRCGKTVWLLSYRCICSSCAEDILEQILNSPCVRNVYEQQLFYTAFLLSAVLTEILRRKSFWMDLMRPWISLMRLW